MNNLISLNLTPEEDEAIKQAISTLNATLLPKLITLTKEERIELPKMGDKTLAFTTKANEYTAQNDTLVPPYFSVEEFTTDLNATTRLRGYEQQLAPLMQALDDSIMAAGSEAYQAALLFYSIIKTAAENNVPGAKVIADELSQRFSWRTRSTDEAAE
ncbi:hypothetical protein [Prolixibacter sp. NT017]|uniref:hypothetical protein n=1 Tax=Prolixibacter sp. NT017 TaxID=2652390 RepID=UPI00127E1799|nr:hypothetical protein [Prolixibacter sp. NT017]GET24474.1 hypothetical protein NT017_08030 [Prolixibacter sp. NT017]